MSLSHTHTHTYTHSHTVTFEEKFQFKFLFIRKCRRDAEDDTSYDIVSAYSSVQKNLDSNTDFIILLLCTSTRDLK